MFVGRCSISSYILHEVLPGTAWALRPSYLWSNLGWPDGILAYDVSGGNLGIGV